MDHSVKITRPAFITLVAHHCRLKVAGAEETPGLKSSGNGAIYRHLRGLGATPDLAEQLTSVVMVTAIDKFDAGKFSFAKGAGGLVNWLKDIAHSKYVDHCRVAGAGFQAKKSLPRTWTAPVETSRTAALIKAANAGELDGYYVSQIDGARRRRQERKRKSKLHNPGPLPASEVPFEVPLLSARPTDRHWYRSSKKKLVDAKRVNGMIKYFPLEEKYFALGPVTFFDKKAIKTKPAAYPRPRYIEEPRRVNISIRRINGPVDNSPLRLPPLYRFPEGSPAAIQQLNRLGPKPHRPTNEPLQWQSRPGIPVTDKLEARAFAEAETRFWSDVAFKQTVREIGQQIYRPCPPKDPEWAYRKETALRINGRLAKHDRSGSYDLSHRTKTPAPDTESGEYAGSGSTAPSLPEALDYEDYCPTDWDVTALEEALDTLGQQLAAGEQPDGTSSLDQLWLERILHERANGKMTRAEYDKWRNRYKAEHKRTKKAA